MRDEQLKYILERIDTRECEETIEDYIYYSKTFVKQARFYVVMDI